MGTTEALLIPFILLVIALICGEGLVSVASKTARAKQFRAQRRTLRRPERLGPYVRASLGAEIFRRHARPQTPSAQNGAHASDRDRALPDERTRRNQHERGEESVEI